MDLIESLNVDLGVGRIVLFCKACVVVYACSLRQTSEIQMILIQKRLKLFALFHLRSVSHNIYAIL